MTTYVVIKTKNGVLVNKFNLIDKADFLLDLAITNTTENERLDKNFPLFCLKLGNIYRPTILALINQEFFNLDPVDLQNLNKINENIEKYPTLKNILDIKYIKNYTISKEDFGGREFKFIESESSIDVGYRECPQDTNIDDFFFSFYFKY